MASFVVLLQLVAQLLSSRVLPSFQGRIFVANRQDFQMPAVHPNPFTATEEQVHVITLGDTVAPEASRRKQESIGQEQRAAPGGQRKAAARKHEHAVALNVSTSNVSTPQVEAEAAGRPHRSASFRGAADFLPGAAASMRTIYGSHWVAAGLGALTGFYILSFVLADLFKEARCSNMGAVVFSAEGPQIQNPLDDLEMALQIEAAVDDLSEARQQIRGAVETKETDDGAASSLPEERRAAFFGRPSVGTWLGHRL
eukprot:TRINITY_DN17600_c0_g1_i1.p1 TRINITY_DN17600_c0_g1~~TRINITY_DN17600_c0_g1_i1.p1  ORF type:complete len:275 (-),score=39.52 TRINITY_DN17600_c0_g1_i1:213-977(-)